MAQARRMRQIGAVLPGGNGRRERAPQGDIFQPERFIWYTRPVQDAWKSTMADPDFKWFGKNLRSFRERAKLSQRELADRAGMDQSTYSRLERGVTSVPLGTLLAVARALDISPAQLVEAANLEPEKFANSAELGRLMQKLRRLSPARRRVVEATVNALIEAADEF